ncbi:type II toxin-antitoxin system Phd/YefM family antitoxin [Polaromonas glacialis]|uniref:type II toxin-antitoxin system Phd/YefM family antitoxin n=1 Tax=Polaromonas glacialis TaxID=866564 RepID=UPI0006906827|nr:type II toxin-antitoxin system Phd/YefM family antitoxin [Polaromonas glacialis]
MLREATAMNVRQNLGELLNGVQYRHDSIVITKAGKPVAALVDMATFERMRRKNDGEFEKLWAQFSKGFEDMSEAEVEELVNAEVKAVRSDMMAEQAEQDKPAP